MSEDNLGSERSDHSSADVVPLEAPAVETPRRRATDRISADADALTRFEQEQLLRELADIELASAALRLGEPALQSWSKPSMPAVPKVRPLWLLIGVLWLSTALVTVGAVAAIATLAG